MPYNYEEACEYFKEYGCKMITKKKDYKDEKTKIKWKCECKVISETTFISYKSTKYHLCNNCAVIKRTEYTQELSYTTAKNYFIQYGCELLTPKEDYKNTKTKVKWKCVCGIISECIFSGYKGSKTHLCKKCGYEARKENNMEKFGVENVGQLKKYSYKEVKEYYESQECELISKEYKNAHGILIYKCKCGNTNESRYCDFKNKDSRCRECGKESRAKTNLEKYNSEFASQNKIVKQKMKISNLAKYGVEYACQSEIVKEKIKKSNLEKYGVEYSLSSKIVREKIENTNLTQYGFRNVSQNREILYKMLVQKSKDYKLPSGKIIKIDGYEHFALNILLKTYKENEIITCLLKVPAIIYKMDNKHVYYPDIYIPKENKIIEVKSKYYFDLKKNKNIAKKEACLKAGYNFEFWIFDKDGNIINEDS